MHASNANSAELGSLAEFSERQNASRAASAILTINSPQHAGRTISRVLSPPPQPQHAGRTMSRVLSSTEATTLNSTEPVKAHGDFVPASSLPLVPVCTPESTRMDPLKLEPPGAPVKKPKRDSSPSSDEDGEGGRAASRVNRRRRLTSEDLKADEAEMPSRMEISDYASGGAAEEDVQVTQEYAAESDESHVALTQSYVPNPDPEQITAAVIADADAAAGAIDGADAADVPRAG
jgi:hypothetical protein